MTIEIKQKDAHWVVVADTPSGKEHTGGFESQEAAVKFAQEYHGGVIHNHQNTAPATTQEQCNKYEATCTSCGCPDKVNRGGSYTFGPLQVCKHQAHQLQRAFDIFNANETEKGLHVRDGFCGCMGFIKSGFNTCAHLLLLSNIQWAMAEAEKPVKRELTQAEEEALFDCFD